jgi:hypothetical protein
MIRVDHELRTWRGWDRRLAQAARQMAKRCGAKPDLLVVSPVTRRRLGIAIAAKTRSRYQKIQAIGVSGSLIHVVEEDGMRDNVFALVIVEGSDQLDAA